jgi:drug/metabolite transporter (DMT)-like permease
MARAIPEWVGFPLMLLYISLFAGWNVVAEWATSGIAPPAVLVLSGVRALNASAIMWVFYLLRSRCGRDTPVCPPRAHLKRIAYTGVLRSFTSVFFGIGLSMAGSVNASVFHSIVPGITALVAVMMGYEQLRWRRIAGISLAMVGAIIVLGADELLAWHNGTGAKRRYGTGVGNDDFAYAPKDDPTRSSPQSRAITLSGVSAHDLHFSRAHVGLLMLVGYCTTYTAYYVLMHALTRLKATPTAVSSAQDGDESDAGSGESDDAEGRAAALDAAADAAAAASASGTVVNDIDDPDATPPTHAVSAERQYSADHMMALLQFASGTATMLCLALYALIGAVRFVRAPLSLPLVLCTRSSFAARAPRPRPVRALLPRLVRRALRPARSVGRATHAPPFSAPTPAPPVAMRHQVAMEDLAQCWTWSFAVAVIYGSIGLSVFAYLAEMMAIRLVGAAMTSLSIALDPPMTLFFGAIFLRHALNPYIIPGVILIAVGIVISALSKGTVEQIVVAVPPAVVELETRGAHRRVATADGHEA